MKRRVFIVIVILLQTATFFAQSKKAAVDNCADEPKFKFIIIDNTASKDADGTHREMLIFLDPKAFNTENLKSLFTKLSRKYPLEEYFYISVSTSWETTPSSLIYDCERPGQSGSSSDSKKDESHWALFIRSGKDEIFRFNPELGSSDIETVLLKGKKF
jgi:hypothetical protein